MNTTFVFLMVISFVFTLLYDRQRFKQAGKGGKLIYGVLAGLVLVLLFSGVFDYNVMFLTQWVTYQIAPKVHEIVNTVQ